MARADVEMEAVQAWLPDEAIAWPAIAPVLDPFLCEWSTAWFAKGEPRAREIVQDDVTPNSVGWSWAGDELAIETGDSTRYAIAAAMLGHPVIASSLRPNDRVIIDHIAGCCLDDLLARLTAFAGHSGVVGKSNGSRERIEWRHWEIVLERASRPIRVVISRAVLANMMRRRLSEAETVSIGFLEDALVEQRTHMSLMLGRCSLTLGELDGLSVGDVVVLDTLTEEPLDLAIAGGPVRIKCKVDDAGEQTILTIQQN